MLLILQHMSSSDLAPPVYHLAWRVTNLVPNTEFLKPEAYSRNKLKAQQAPTPCPVAVEQAGRPDGGDGS